MSRILSFTLLFLAAHLSLANGLTVTNSSYNATTNELSFNISWSNAWFVETSPGKFSMDGAWVFVKYAPNGGPSWQHIDILTATSGTPNVNTQIGNNNHGVIVRADICNGSTNCSINNVSITLELDALIGVNPDFKIFAMEMVFVPQDAFYLGDGISSRTYYEYPDTLTPYKVNSSALISVGTTAGELNKKGFTFTTDIPAEYPKGFRKFWAMKYKISAQQYVEFLNTLDRVAQNNRTESDVSSNTIADVFVMTTTSSPFQRNPIRCNANVPGGPIEFYCDLDNDGVPNEFNDGQNLIANHLSREDVLAFLDWAAMRPHTKMEYEKMCRGPLYPVAGEYAWGSSSFSEAVLSNLVDGGEGSETFDNIGSGPIWPDFYATDFVGARCGFAATATSSRLTSGATFYGIQDMHSGGSMYFGESTSNLANIDYFLSQGDGSLATNGDANVSSWSIIGLNGVPSYFKDPISNGSLYNLTQRSSYSCARGVVVLNP